MSAEETLNVFFATGENADLSNFAIRPFETVILGQRRHFKTVESAFHAAKLEHVGDTSLNAAILDELIEAEGAQAKRLGRNIKGVDVASWDLVSAQVMKRLMLESFRQNPSARCRLDATGSVKLTHVRDGVEQDGGRFSRLLMEVRDELRSAQGL